MHTVVPFWNALAASLAEDNIVELELQKQAFATVLQVAAKDVATKLPGKKPIVCEAFKMQGKAGAAKVLLSVPYFTNTTAVQRGQSLVFKEVLA